MSKAANEIVPGIRATLRTIRTGQVAHVFNELVDVILQAAILTILDVLATTLALELFHTCAHLGSNRRSRRFNREGTLFNKWASIEANLDMQQRFSASSSTEAMRSSFSPNFAAKSGKLRRLHLKKLSTMEPWSQSLMRINGDRSFFA